jgi:hypothetical protein
MLHADPARVEDPRFRSRRGKGLVANGFQANVEHRQDEPVFRRTSPPKPPVKGAEFTGSTNYSSLLQATQPFGADQRGFAKPKHANNGSYPPLVNGPCK